MKVIITLKKSVIGSKPDQVATVKALGLKKTNSSVEKDDTTDKGHGAQSPSSG